MGLADKLGGAAAFDRLANEIVEQDDALMARAYALRDIDERFPASRLAGLSPEDRDAVTAVTADHRRAALEKGTAIGSLVAAIDDALGLAAPSPRPRTAYGLFQSAQRMDRIVNVIFGGSPSSLGTTELVAELNAARAQLAAALEAIR